MAMLPTQRAESQTLPMCWREHSNQAVKIRPDGEERKGRSKQAMSDTPMDLFVGMSAVLTGVDKSKLAPDLDPVNIKKTYFDFVQSKAGATFQQLLNIYNQ